MRASIHGQGSGTILKERSFASALTLGLQISQKPKLAKYSYFHADLHCGPGWNHERQCAGSPAVFLRAAEAVGRSNYHAFFVDKERSHIAALEATVLMGNPRCYAMCGDNESVLPVLERFIINAGEKPRYAIGSVLIDPNGYLDGVPVDALRKFAARFERMDLILNFNMRTKRLGESHIQKGTGRWASKTWLDLAEMPAAFSRPYQYGLIQERVTYGDPFVTMVLRNIDTGDHRALGLVKMTSPQGERIVEKYRRKDGRVRIVETGQLSFFSPAVV